jgi:branched-chain amino acid transport system permease protein
MSGLRARGASLVLDVGGGSHPLGIVSRLLAPVEDLGGDIANLDPVLLQLIAFSLLLGGIYGLVALGLTMVFGVMDVVNFAHGAFLAVAMYATWILSSSQGVPLPIAVPVAVLVVAILGVVVYQSTISPIIDEPQHNQLVVTFAILLILENGLSIYFSPNRRSLGVDLEAVSIGSVNLPMGQLIGFGLALTASLLVWAFLHYTHFGRAIRGTAVDRESAKYTGINIDRVYQVTFAIGAALAAIAGVAIAMYRHFDPYIGHTYLINAFVIVVLGGMGSFPGAFLGGLVIGFAQIFGTYYMPGTSYNVLIFGVFILVLLVKPEGIFGGGYE